MSQEIPDGSVLPTPQPAKTIGILNIVFGSVMVLVNLCCGFYSLSLPALMGPMKMQVEAERKAQLDNLQQREEAAGSEEEKASLRAERDRLAATPVPSPDADLRKIGIEDRRFLGHFGLEVGTGLILNVALFVAGIGLTQLRGWARMLAIWVCGLKIARLLLLALSAMFVVAPMMVGKIAALPNPGDGPRVVGILFTVYGLGFLALGSIYPAIALVVLSRPGVRAACEDREADPWR